MSRQDLRNRYNTIRANMHMLVVVLLFIAALCIFGDR